MFITIAPQVKNLFRRLDSGINANDSFFLNMDNGP